MPKKPSSKAKKDLRIFVIAGEASGDILGGKLISSIKKQVGTERKIIICGIGGEKMHAEGVKSIFSMSDLSLFGLAEIIPHIPNILKRINQTVKAIIDFKPDILITVDAPDFCFRVVKKLNKSKGSDTIKKVHMIAPSVWVYREGRAKKIAKLYDLLLAILPFEPPYFEKYGLKTKFIGHPIVENEVDKSKFLSKSDFYIKYDLSSKDEIICLTPGSRVGEVKRLLPVFLDAVNILHKDNEKLAVGIATTNRVESLVKEEIEKFKERNNLENSIFKIAIIKDEYDKHLLYQLSKVAIAKSGTNTFELMMAKLPMVVCYKFNWLTAKIGKLIVKTKFCNLANIILKKKVIPELVQEDCTSENITKEVNKLLTKKSASEKQTTETQKVLKTLGYGSKEKSSDLAAKYVLELLK